MSAERRWQSAGVFCDSGEPRAMLEDQFIELIDPLLLEGLGRRDRGRVSRAAAVRAAVLPPPSGRLNRVPIFGEAHSVVMVDPAAGRHRRNEGRSERLLTRLAMAANGRFPPWRGLVIGLTAIVLTPEPIEPADDAMLREVLGVKLGRMRVVPFGLIRVNLGQEAIALAIQSEPRRPLHRARTLSPMPCASILPAIRAAALRSESNSGLGSRRAGIIPVERDLERLPPGLDAGGRVDVTAQPTRGWRLDRVGQLVVAGPGISMLPHSASRRARPSASACLRSGDGFPSARASRGTIV